MNHSFLYECSILNQLNANTELPNLSVFNYDQLHCQFLFLNTKVGKSKDDTSVFTVINFNIYTVLVFLLYFEILNFSMLAI